jgi:hypothetical protein
MSSSQDQTSAGRAAMRTSTWVVGQSETFMADPSLDDGAYGFGP